MESKKGETSIWIIISLVIGLIVAVILIFGVADRFGGVNTLDSCEDGKGGVCTSVPEGTGCPGDQIKIPAGGCKDKQICCKTL
jgi:hypothetical protein